MTKAVAIVIALQLILRMPVAEAIAQEERNLSENVLPASDSLWESGEHYGVLIFSAAKSVLLSGVHAIYVGGNGVEWIKHVAVIGDEVLWTVCTILHPEEVIGLMNRLWVWGARPSFQVIWNIIEVNKHAKHASNIDGQKQFSSSDVKWDGVQEVADVFVDQLKIYSIWHRSNPKALEKYKTFVQGIFNLASLGRVSHVTLPPWLNNNGHRLLSVVFVFNWMYLFMGVIPEYHILDYLEGVVTVVIDAVEYQYRYVLDYLATYFPEEHCTKLHSKGTNTEPALPD